MKRWLLWLGVGVVLLAIGVVQIVNTQLLSQYETVCESSIPHTTCPMIDLATNYGIGVLFAVAGAALSIVGLWERRRESRAAPSQT